MIGHGDREQPVHSSHPSIHLTRLITLQSNDTPADPQPTTSGEWWELWIARLIYIVRPVNLGIPSHDRLVSYSSNSCCARDIFRTKFKTSSSSQPASSNLCWNVFDFVLPELIFLLRPIIDSLSWPRGVWLNEWPASILHSFLVSDCLHEASRRYYFQSHTGEKPPSDMTELT